MNVKTLNAIYGELKCCSLNPSDYAGEMADAVFEIVSADTFVAGVASTLLEGSNLNPTHRQILAKQYLNGTTWTLSDGRCIDLREAKDVECYAHLVERLRRNCLKYIEERGQPI